MSQKRGKAEPLAWAYAYGKGRVFQTLLGHNELSLAAGGTAELVRRGSVWAASREQRPIERQDINPKDTAPPRTPPQKNEPGAKILPPDPGLDGGKGGHWGEKNDKDWVDTRLDKMQFGPMVSHTFETAGHRANKGIALRVGESQEAAVLLDAQTGALVAGWTGDFLKFDPARFGLIGRHKIAGKLEWELGDQLCFRGARKVQYRGLHRDGNRVIFEYDVDGVRVLDSPWAYTAGGVTAFTRDMELGAGFGDAHIVLNDGKCYSSFHTDQPTGGIKIAWSDDRKRMEFSMAKRDTPLRVRLYFIAMKHGQLNTFPARDAAREERIYDFDRLAKGGAPLWGKPIEVKGHVNDRDKPYVIDTIPVPYDNPFGALMFLSGIDFFDNGDAAVSTVHGDVWLVRGLDRTLAKVTWQRFATGLYQPLGVRIVNNKVHVLGRDQITILHDRNDDGEADFYENFSSTIHTSAGGHDYVTSLEVDREGNFYYVDPRGVHRISTDGKTNDTLATGFRNPNGLSVGPDGTITVAPQEGDWTPASMICQFSPAPESGSASASAKGTPYFGYGGPRVTPDRPLGYDPPLVYLPRLVDNSSGSQVWVTSDKWGPLKGQLLNLSFGRSSMQLILREEIDGVFNGAVVPLPHRFLSGVMRGAFHPKDGQLYVVGMNGWVTNAARDGCLQRVRYTGKQPALPIAFETRPTDLRITFSQPLDKELAEDVDGYAAEQWNYRYSSAYGSKDYSVANPNVEGHDAVKVKSVKLEADGKTIVLDLGELKSVHQLRLRYDLDTAAGEGLRGEIVFTINRVTE